MIIKIYKLIYKQKVTKSKNIKIKNEIVRFNRYEFLLERFAKEISEFFIFSSVSGMEKQIKIIKLFFKHLERIMNYKLLYFKHKEF
jgi:hypothetical protein